MLKNRSWFTGNQLKYAVAVLMVFDHLHQFLYPGVQWLTILGRLVAPVFIYMVAEGMYYTRSRKQYVLQLLVGAQAMFLLNIIVNRIFVFGPIDWDAFYNGVTFGARDVSNNIFATMFLIALIIVIIDYAIVGFREKRFRQAALGVLAMAALVGWAYAEKALAEMIMNAVYEGRAPRIAKEAMTFLPTLFNAEGGWAIIVMGVAFYYFRRWRWAQMLAIAATALYFFFSNHALEYGDVQWMMVFSAIPLFFYNGKRGKGVSPKFDKWFFYIFYPAHIYLLFIIAWAIQR